MDSAEPLSSILWTLTPHPGGSAAAGHFGCRGFVAHLGSCIPVQVATPQFGICYRCLCSGRYRLLFRRFRSALGRSFFIIGGMDCSFLRLRGVLPKSFVGFALTAVESVVWADTVMEKPDH